MSTVSSSEKWVFHLIPYASILITRLAIEWLISRSKGRHMKEATRYVTGENRAAKLPVTFIGIQETKEPNQKFTLVNQPDGSTVIFNPRRHEIVKKRKPPFKARRFTDQTSKPGIGRVLGKNNIESSERRRASRIEKENPPGR